MSSQEILLEVDVHAVVITHKCGQPKSISILLSLTLREVPLEPGLGHLMSCVIGALNLLFVETFHLISI